MTRLAILSDIHGNLPALEAVMADLAEQQVEQVIVAGDLINWGPFSAQVVARVREAGWATIRGNHELTLLDHGTPREPAIWADRAAFPVPHWLQRQIPHALKLAIALWPDTLVVRPPDAPPLRIVHGSPRDHAEPIYPDVTEVELAPMLAGIAETTIVAGHTHRPLDRRIGRWHVLNPGAVGMMLDNDQRASYLILEGNAEGWRGELRRVPYDKTPLFAEFARLGFVEECGLIGALVVEEFATTRLRLAPFLRWRAAVAPDAPFDDATLALFRTVDPEDYMPVGHRLPAR